MGNNVKITSHQSSNPIHRVLSFSAGGLGGLVSFFHNAADGLVDVELYGLDSCVSVTVPPENLRSHGVQRFYAMKIEANNDSNGNPRRGWLIYDADGAFQGFADEYYRGNGALINVAAILAGHNVEAGSQGAGTNAHYDGRGGATASGPNGTVVVSVLGITATTPAEYRHALWHGTKKDPMYPDTIYRQF